MASKPLSPPQLELHESEIAKPQPLRIIKRSKTISGCSTAGEAIYRGGGGSVPPNQSQGSPPLAADRPLTVHKMRKGRESILNIHLEDGRGVNLASWTSGLLKNMSDLQDDPDLTPKARKPVPRTVSAGAFLKDEYHLGKFDRDAGRHSVRIHGHGINDPDLDYYDQPCDPVPIHNTSPKIPELRFSRSKNFLLRAIGGRNAEFPRSIRRTESTMSNKTLIRRLSRGRSRSPGSYASSNNGSIMSSDAACSFESTSGDIADVSLNSRISSFDDQALSSSASESASSLATRDPPSPTSGGNVFVLCPHIMVTPEIPSVDGSLCTLWVAIEISGVLRRAEGEGHCSREVKRCPFQSMNPRLLDLRHYGKLQSMRIELHPGQGCKVLEIVGNLHDLKTIRASETHLILAKIRLDKIGFSPGGDENSSDQVMADLQNHLGECVSSYLTVRLLYKHSAFRNDKISALDSEGMKCHITRTETEATATIKRRNPESDWSLQTSQTMGSPLEPNPLIKLIETHFLPDKAQDVLKKLAEDHWPISTRRRFGSVAGGSSEETEKQTFETSSHAARTGSAISLSLLCMNSASQESSLHRTTESMQTGGYSKILADGTGSSGQQSKEIDPARKIWTEMRLTSRGGRNRAGRKSISADDYFSIEDETTPTRASSRDNSVSTSSRSKTKDFRVGVVDQERNRILEVALKNKRSVGTETLRSIAPSVSRSVAKPKGGTISGVGLRAWGWGPPWW